MEGLRLLPALPLVSPQHPLGVKPKTVLLARKNVHRVHLVYHKARQRGMDLELRGHILIAGTVDNLQICISYPDLSSKLKISGCLCMDATRHLELGMFLHFPCGVVETGKCYLNNVCGIHLSFLNTYIYSITITNTTDSHQLELVPMFTTT